MRALLASRDLCQIFGRLPMLTKPFTGFSVVDESLNHIASNSCLSEADLTSAESHLFNQTNNSTKTHSRIPRSKTTQPEA
jgi:hypothetical protein